MVVRYACTHICTCVCVHTHIRTHIEILISDNNWTYYLIMVECLAHASCNDRDRIINICITSSIQHFFVLGAFKILSCSYYKIYNISHSPYCALAWDLLFFSLSLFFFSPPPKSITCLLMPASDILFSTSVWSARMASTYKDEAFL